MINQMLFSIKAEAVAERAIARLREGKKPVIAFASTMGSFIEQMETDSGLAVTDGDTINADFSVVLQKGLDGILRYTETDTDGQKIFKKFEISDFPIEAQYEYNRISDRIKEAATGITISPIDVIIRKIAEAGYKLAEVTGRKYELQINPKTNKALVVTRKRLNTNDAFRQFNNNEVDVLLINQSGSTGASAHAIITPKVPKEQVSQRVMIVLQAELDINTEVQKRGRINRTGQIMKPIYDYVNSAIPAEKRLMMMLQKKLKSLDANTTSNQKSSTKILDVPDFLNKYGDRIVAEYLKENQEVNMLLDDPLGLATREVDGAELEDAAHKVSGRVAVLSTAMQQDFYNEISIRY
ncbi:MAG TPA: strawberry notch C-terminal domain-containing protein, partial [Cyclobacteriaceae bacterium]|nr:strawberry notch C-terminal domain-containing protein [Cyclobacteriaceae bacterium]